MAENTQKKHALTPAMIERKWKPGETGNPGGRPKKNPVTDYLREQLEAPIPQGMLDSMKEAARLVFFEIYGENPTFGQMVAFKTIQSAAKGDVFALKELLDRVEGKVTQKMDVNIDGSLSDRIRNARARRENAGK